ncbi:tRNA(His) guanylyltransferase 1 isoform X1 [Ziziphus jujuba]|uniref:tRNA(His) guanylyltransferase n=1 Tax=Ziziphus jujuba TaxID=326968 RepID=A0ABM3IUH0_ZIZJJ|nr:tRNA(His) guanylyltransferase 1 isoform X1 [Ziziphus jujuba]XP_048335654.2 tRNA(His) guanylyltransferase 1 isoform X1 [Ziziphus jujuba]
MANSKYEYVKSFEPEDEVLLPNLIVVRIDGRDFRRFCEVHEFVKPNDEIALNLMNSCAVSVMEKFPDIVFSYGFSDEYSFVFKKTTTFYRRRASKVHSLIVSFFTAEYVLRWKEFFPYKELRYAPSFCARVICCATIEVLQSYLSWRQNECHVNNQNDTCLYELVRHGKTEKEAQEFLKGTQKNEKHALLFEQFGINYEKLSVMVRQGSCILKTQMEDIVKYNENGVPVKRPRKRPIIVHSKNVAGTSFWNEHESLLKELGCFVKNIGKVDPDFVRSFQFEKKLMPSTWIVIRIDGCHFHSFSKDHEFVKPNDERALNLMNSCAVAVVTEFQDIVFSYGVSDEYSFVLKKDSQLYQRRESDIASAIVSFFTSMYVMKWKYFFPRKELKYTPFFDGRAVCYPSSQILRDYLAWRQVDCHINNQYNTCFWELVKSGKSEREAQNVLKGTQTLEKMELLKQFGISDYNKLPVMFRQGSSAYWEKEDISLVEEKGAASNGKCQKKVILEHCNIIEPSFWNSHPNILGEKLDIL